jgi:hypothetical protein
MLAVVLVVVVVLVPVRRRRARVRHRALLDGDAHEAARAADAVGAPNDVQRLAHRLQRSLRRSRQRDPSARQLPLLLLVHHRRPLARPRRPRRAAIVLGGRGLRRHGGAA